MRQKLLLNSSPEQSSDINYTVRSWQYSSYQSSVQERRVGGVSFSPLDTSRGDQVQDRLQATRPHWSQTPLEVNFIWKISPYTSFRKQKNTCSHLTCVCVWVCAPRVHVWVCGSKGRYRDTLLIRGCQHHCSPWGVMTQELFHLSADFYYSHWSIRDIYTNSNVKPASPSLKLLLNQRDPPLEELSWPDGDIIISLMCSQTAALDRVDLETMFSQTAALERVDLR